MAATSGIEKAAVTLDVETDEERQNRLRQYFVLFLLQMTFYLA